MNFSKFDQFFPLPAYLRKLKELVATSVQIDAVVVGATVTGVEISKATNYVNGNAEITSYPIDFTPLVSRAGANAIYMNNNPVSSSGHLKSLRVKSDVGTTITSYIYNVSGTSGSYSFTLLHTYEAKVITAIEETLTYTDTYEIPVGAYIALKSTSNLYFKSATYASKKIGATTDQNVILAFDFVVEKAEASLDSKLIGINNNITELKTKKFNKSILYKNPMIALSDFEQVNWSATSVGLSPTVSAETSYLWLKKKYHIEDILYSFDIVLRTGSIFVIEFESLTYPQGNGKFKINFATNKLEIYNDVSGVETLVSNTTISFSLVDNTKYTIQIKKQNGVNLEIKIIDIATGNSSICSYISNSTAALTGQNRMMDTIKFYQQSGSDFNIVSNLIITSVKNPLLLLMGDSITEGVYFSMSNFNSRYGILLKDALNGNLIVSARGGATLAEIAERVTTEIQFVKPEFVMLTIGTNGGLVESSLVSLVSSIEALGSKVIINHVPNRANGSHIATNNIIDNVCNTTNAILGAKFDIATSIAGNPANSYIVEKYFDAGVHPNAIGQKAMYDRFKIDLPFLFD